MRRNGVIGLFIAALTAFAVVPSAALAAPTSPPPWEADELAGLVVLEGSIGVPDIRVTVVGMKSHFNPPTNSDILGGFQERTGPHGEFRIELGTCQWTGMCFEFTGGEVQVMFHRSDLNKVPWWAPGTAHRGSAQVVKLPNIPAGPRAQRIIHVTSTAPPLYQTISGTVRGDQGPLSGVTVLAWDLKGHSHHEYGYSNQLIKSNVARTGVDGRFTMNVPPGQWQLKYSDRDQFGSGWQGRFEDTWAGCKPTQAGSTVVTSGATNADIRLGKSCSSAVPRASYPIRGVKAVSKKSGTVQVRWKAPVPGTLSAVVRAKSKRKTVTVAKATVTVTKARTVSLKLTPTKAAKRLVAKQGKITAALTVTFKPTAGTATTAKLKATFRRPPGR